MIDFFRFPHTPHLAWLAAGRPRDGKVFTPDEVREFLSGAVVVEEKVDGSNLGLSVDTHGELRAQNRGSYLDLETPSGQWKPLKRWLSEHRHALSSTLHSDLILFGEWCYAVHSLRYARLADWYLAFDVYDRAHEEFWSSERRNELAKRVGLAVVPEIARGHFNRAQLERLLGASRLTDGPAEGLYVRREEGGHLLARAKLVQAEFVSAIGEHWSRRTLEANQVHRRKSGGTGR